MKRTVRSMGRLPTPGGGLANETSASIFFLSGKALSKNPCKLSLTRDSFESFSGNVMEENCSLMIGLGVENYTSSERMHRLKQQVKYQAARSCQGKHRIWEWIRCVLHSHTHYGKCDYCFILKKKNEHRNVLMRKKEYFSVGFGFQKDVDIRYKDVKRLNRVKFSFNSRH